MAAITPFLLPGTLYILTLAFGFWLSHAGKPINPILFNIHKLTALAAIVLFALRTIPLLKIAEIQGLLILLVVIAVVSVLALFASGALMSAGKLSYAVMLLVHQIAPVLLTLALAAVIYLANRARS